jgi:thiamine biosynthesis lipoprotein
LTIFYLLLFDYQSAPMNRGCQVKGFYMNKKDSQILIIITCVFLVVATYFFIRPKQPVEADSGYRMVMGTIAHIIAVAPDAHTANKSIEAAFEQFRNIETLMSYHKDDSELANVNRNAYKSPVKVSPQTFEVIQKAIEFSSLSDGAFDITVGPLMDLWRSAAEANAVPDDAKLAESRAKVGYEKLILDANEKTVRFAVEGMKLDLGGIAKGYAIDKAVEAMQTCGSTGGMVDVGGNIRCFGRPPKGKTHWLIGLQDPDVKSEIRNLKSEIPIGMSSEPLLVLKLTNAAVATSGHYRRFALIQGKKYSHIIDTKTGSGSDKLASVTIIAKDAITADALSTAVTIMGAEKGLALIEKLPETEAILIPALPKLTLLKTRGVEKYIK